MTNASKIWLLYCWEFTVMILTKTTNYYQPAPDYLCNKSKKTSKAYLELPLWLQTLDNILKWFVILRSQTIDGHPLAHRRINLLDPPKQYTIFDLDLHKFTKTAYVLTNTHWTLVTCQNYSRYWDRAVNRTWFQSGRCSKLVINVFQLKYDQTFGLINKTVTCAMYLLKNKNAY